VWAKKGPRIRWFIGTGSTGSLEFYSLKYYTHNIVLDKRADYKLLKKQAHSGLAEPYATTSPTVDNTIYFL